MGIQIKKKVSSEGLLFLIYLFLFLNFILPSNHHSPSYTFPISPHFTIPCPLPIHHSQWVRVSMGNQQSVKFMQYHASPLPRIEDEHSILP